MTNLLPSATRYLIDISWFYVGILLEYWLCIREKGGFVDKREILKSYFDIVVEELTEWINQATGIISKFSSVAAVTHIVAGQLRRINNSINSLKGSINVLYLTYKDMEKEYELKPLSAQYMIEFSEKVQEVESIIKSIKRISNQYDDIIEISRKQHINIDEYVTQTNQESIKILKSLNEKSFPKLLETGNFVGL